MRIRVECYSGYRGEQEHSMNSPTDEENGVMHRQVLAVAGLTVGLRAMGQR